MKWIKLRKYIELTGETTETVRNKRRYGYWLDNVHYKKAPDGGLWINIQAVEEWLDKSQRSYR
jgi:hypothetical protein